MEKGEALELFFGKDVKEYHPKQAEFIEWLYDRGYLIIKEDEYLDLVYGFGRHI